jgi:hypothetical protein
MIWRCIKKIPETLVRLSKARADALPELLQIAYRAAIPQNVAAA